MKKLLLLILSGIFCLCLVSCSREKQIALTSENINEYIEITDQVTDSTIKKERESIFGITFYSYDNSHASAKIMVNRKSEKYTFENLTITVKMSVHANADYSWQFKNQNQFETLNNMHYNYKIVTLEIPYTGEYTLDEQFILGKNELNYSVLETWDLSHITVEIISVSGTVIVKK